MFFVQPACNQHNAISSFLHLFHLFQLIDPYDFFILDLCEIMLALLLFEAHYLISMFRCFGQFVVPGRYFIAKFFYCLLKGLALHGK